MATIDTQTLTTTIVEWVRVARTADETGQVRPRIPECVGRDILSIACRVVRRYYWTHSERDDLVGVGVLRVLTTLDQYDAETSSDVVPWIYTVCRRAMASYLYEESRGRYVAVAYARHLTDLQIARCREYVDAQRDLVVYHEARLARKRETNRQISASKPKRAPKVILPDGTGTSALALARRLGIPRGRVYYRLRTGMSVADIIAKYS